MTNICGAIDMETVHFGGKSIAHALCEHLDMELEAYTPACTGVLALQVQLGLVSEVFFQRVGFLIPFHGTIPHT